MIFSLVGLSVPIPHSEFAITMIQNVIEEIHPPIAITEDCKQPTLG